MIIYLAGPMTGLPELNYPAFNDAAAKLRAIGHTVINPAENTPPACGTWAGWMRISLRQVCDAECLVMLPGWTHSEGALLEHVVALKLKLRCVPLDMASTIPLPKGEVSCS